MANIVVDRTHKRLLRAAGRLTTGVNSVALVAVLYTTPAPPSLLTVNHIKPRAPRFIRGIRLGATTLHGTFDHVPIGALRATCREYRISMPRDFPRCILCDASNMQRASTYQMSRSAAMYPSLLSWQADLFGSVSTTSRSGGDCGLHNTEGSSNYAYFPGVRHNSDALGAIEVWNASMTADGVRPLVLTTDIGGEFVGHDAARVCTRVSGSLPDFTRRSHTPTTLSMFIDACIALSDRRC